MSETELEAGQTHVQTIGPLLLQVHELGFDRSALAAVRRAYDLAAQLWSVNFQSSGRMFLCHSVGAASMVARHGGSLSTILAGVVHAAYNTGDFGVRIPGATPRRRQQLRDVIGEEAEALVYRFHKLGMEFDTRWDRILGGGKDSSALSALDRDVLFMRICHDLDDLTDYPFSSAGRRRRLEDFSQGSIALAEALGRPVLAGLLRSEHSRRQAQGVLPEEIQGGHSTGYIVVPKAFRKRVVSGLVEVAHRLWTKGTLRP